MKTLNGIVVLLLLLVSSQIQAATAISGQFTYNEINRTCSTTGVGIAAGQSGKISSDPFTFSSGPVVCDSNASLLLELDDGTYWSVTIENNAIAQDRIKECDESDYFLHEYNNPSGCIQPSPTLTKFNSAVSTGIEDNAGMTITYTDLLNKSDVVRSVPSVPGISNTSALHFNVQTIMNNGTLLINGSAWNAESNYQIRSGMSVTYIPGENQTGTVDAFQVVAENNLGYKSPSGVTATISLSALNDPPRKMTNGSLYVGNKLSTVITNSTLRAVDDIDVVIGSEITSDILFEIVSAPSQGSLSKNNSTLSAGATFSQSDINNDQISYTHTGSGTSDVIQLVVKDTSGASNGVSFPLNIIIIQGDSGSPIIAQGEIINVEMSENSAPNPFSINLSATNPAGGDSLMIWRLKSQASNGTAEVFGLGRSPNDEAREFIRYEPNENFDGTDSFTVLVNNGTQNESTITIGVTVNNVNAAPVITQGSSLGITMSEDSSPVSFVADVSATDRDNDDNSLFWDVAFHPLHGTVTLTDTTSQKPTINYTPSENYYGSDSFAVKVSDGAATDTITLSLYVTPQNDPPTLNEGNNISVSMSEDGSPDPFELTLNATDVEGDDIAWSIKTQASNGTVSLNGTGNTRTISYNPKSNFTGTDSFVITVEDQDGSTDNTVVVTVQPVNDGPSITQGDEVSVTMSEEGEGTPFSLTLNATDIDNTASELAWSVTSPPTHGSATVTAGSTDISYIPNTDYFGTDSFVVQVSDGVSSDTITVNVTVENVNDAPVIQEGESLSRTVIEDTPLIVDLTAVDSDSSLAWQVLVQPTHGRIDFVPGFSSPKKIKYTPQLDFNGTDSFTVAVSDGEFSDQITINLTVTTSNDAPYFQEGDQTNVTISEDSFPAPFRLTLHAADNEGDDILWSIHTPPAHGAAKLVVPLSGGRSIGYIPEHNYAGDDSFIIQITDGSLSRNFTVNVTVEPNDDAPIVQNPLFDLAFELGETTTQIPLSNVFSDVDNDEAITISIVSNDNDSLVSAMITGDLLTLSYAEGKAGVSNISLKAVSGAKNVQDHFSVKIEDLIAPVFSNTPLAELTYEATGLETAINLSVPTATDITSVVVSSDSPDKLALGTHTVQWTATDSSGNTSTASQIINIVDTTPPQITLDKPTITFSASSIEGNKVDLGIVQAHDVTNGYLPTTADITLDGAFATLSVGQHTINWQATDASGNTATKAQVVNVVDTTPPQIILGSSVITVDAITKDNNSVDLGVTTANDVIDGAVTVTVNIPLNGSIASLSTGTHTIIWQATDSSGNTTTKAQIVNVVDAAPPEIILTKPSITASASTRSDNQVDLGMVSANDLVDGELTVTSNTSLNGTIATLAVGNHLITWQATDSNGNTATKTQTVNVVDMTPPRITFTSSVITAIASTKDGNEVDLGLVTVNDLVDGVLTATTDTPLNGSVATLSTGQNTITWQATDASGNTATRTQTVTVLDVTPPEITLEKPTITVRVNTETGNLVDLGSVIVNDLVDGLLTATASMPVEGTVATLAIGEHRITWEAVDSSGNEVSVVQLVNVVNSQSPILVINNMAFEATGQITTITTGMLSRSVSVNDPEDGVLTATAQLPLDGELPIGEYNITWQATDSDGNQTSASQIVRINDHTPPDLLVSNLDITVNATGEITPISLSDLGVSANDLVDDNPTIVGEVNGNALSSNLFESGVHYISWFAKDSYGNRSNLKEQILSVVPMVNYSPEQLVSAGDTVSVKLSLTGIAPNYPVTIAYTIDDVASEGVANTDHTATSGTLVFQDQETEGTFTFDISENPALNGSGEGRLVFGLGALNGVIKGYNHSHVINIKVDSVPPVLEDPILQQGGQQVSSFISDGGLATIVVSDPTKELSSNWTMPDELVDLDSSPDTYTFDPSALPLGSYGAEVEVTDDNDYPIQITNISVNFNVIDELLENVIDDDGDGIPNVNDIESSSNTLPVRINDNLNLFLLSEPGAKLKLGSIATIRGESTSLVKPGENDLSNIPDNYTAILNTYNYQVSGIASGYAVTTIIPQDNPIPSDADYLVFNKDIDDWAIFEEDEQNKIASAPYDGDSTLCPPLGDSRYETGLVPGSFCVSLTVVDGGNNDADRATNSQVANIGVVVGMADTTEGSGGGGTTEGSGGGGSLPLQALLLVSLIILFRRKATVHQTID